MTTDQKESGTPVKRDGTIDSEYDGVLGEIEVAIRYLAESDDVVKTVAIGGLLSLFTFLVIPLFILAGYVVRVLDRTAAGDDVPPTFDDWGEMTVTGVKAAVIGLGYGLVPIILGSGLVLVGFVGVGIGSDGPLTGLGVLGILLGGLIWFVLGLLVSYLLPAALANFARTQSLGAGFDFQTLKPIWLSRPYGIAWGTMFLVLLIGGFVTALLNVVPILGTIAGVFVGFYFGVAAYSVIGRAWDDLPVDGHTDHEATVATAGQQ